MRVGMHLGTFVGGVIGQRKLRYDIWGVDVLTTNKIEEMGRPGHICVSQTLRTFADEHFPDRFVFVWQCFIEEYNLNSYRLIQDKQLEWFDRNASPKAQ